MTFHFVFSIIKKGNRYVVIEELRAFIIPKHKLSIKTVLVDKNFSHSEAIQAIVYMREMLKKKGFSSIWVDYNNLWKEYSAEGRII